jgi:hypothetical protein
VGIEELDGAVSDHERPGGELAIVLEVEEVIADLMLDEPVGVWKWSASCRTERR